MPNLTFELDAAAMADIAAAADRRGAPLNEALASRFRGMAREKTKKRTRIASIEHTDGRAIGTIEILPDIASAFGMKAGPLASLAGVVPGDSIVRVQLNGQVMEVDTSKLEVDDGILTIVLGTPHAGATLGTRGAPVTEHRRPRKG